VFHGRLVSVQEVEMRMIAVVILVAGILALVYGGFSYTTQTHEAKLGPLEFSVSENRRVNVPIWAGVAFAVVGGGLLLSGKK
jgi:TRAP-type C4-dicarboxylate transport system permease small subunit